MTDDPDGWRSDRSIVQWVSLFFDEMRWALDEMAQGVPELNLKDLEAAQRALTERVATAVAKIPKDGSDRSNKLGQIGGQMVTEVAAVTSPLSLGSATERVGKFEAAVAQALSDVAKLDQARIDARAALAKIKNSPDAIADKRRAFAQRRKALSAEVESATDLAGFDGIDAGITALAQEVEEQKAIAAARVIAKAAVQDAGGRAAGLVPALDRGALLYINSRVDALRVALTAAETRQSFTTVKSDCDAFMALANEAETYGGDYDIWLKTSAALIAKGPCDATVEWKERDKALAAATAASKTGDFTTARNKLAEFNSRDASSTPPGGVGGSARFDGLADFIDLVEQLEASHGAKLDEVASSSLIGARAKGKDIAKIRKKGLVQGNITDATAEIDPLKAWIEGNLPLARKVAQFHPAAMRVTDYRSKIAEMETCRASQNWAGALVKLDELMANGDVAAQAASLSADKKLKARYDALYARATGGVKPKLKKVWDAHHAAVSASPLNPATLKSTLAALEDWMQIDTVYDARDEVRQIVVNHPEAKGYDYTNRAGELFEQKNFSAALAEIQALKPRLQALCAYLDARKEAEFLLQTLPDDPPDLRQRVQSALDDSEIQARAGNAQGALDDLTAARNAEDLQALALAIVDYQKRAQVVEKEQARVLGFVEENAIKTRLVDGLTAATALATPGLKFAEAFTALTAHMDVLKSARAYATRRLEAEKTIASLDRAVNQDANWATQMFTTGKGLAELKSDFAAADMAGASGKLQEAETAYKQIVADCGHAMGQAVNLFEAADAVNSNAGHSRDSHGAQVTEQEHLTRLTTGVAPGARVSPTNTSSSFHSDSDWLAGREIGAQKAQAAGVDVNSKSLPWPGPEPTAQMFILDHGRAIDTAYRGVRPKQTYDAGADQFKASKTYETYEVLTGLTRALVNFTWECDLLNGIKHSNLQDYATAYAAGNSNTQPASIPGRWVMMQHFPWAEDWNQSEQRYDKPIT